MEVIWWAVGSITSNPWLLFFLAIIIYVCGYLAGADKDIVHGRKMPRKEDDSR